MFISLIFSFTSCSFSLKDSLKAKTCYCGYSWEMSILKCLINTCQMNLECVTENKLISQPQFPN